MKEVLKRVSKSNKGFSLLEILVAIVLLAIIMTPLLKGFVTTANINKNSRIYMGGIDVAESILEGITNKTFKQFSDSVDQIVAGSDLTGELCLSRISNDDYNKAVNYIDAATVMPTAIPAVSNVKNTTIDISGTTMNTSDVIQDGTQANITKTWTSLVASNTDNGRDKSLTYWRDADNKSVFLCYTGVNVDNRMYTVGISVIPCAHNESDKYITYSIYMNTLMFDVTKGALVETGDLTSGIRAYQ